MYNETKSNKMHVIFSTLENSILEINYKFIISQVVSNSFKASKMQCLSYLKVTV